MQRSSWRILTLISFAGFWAIVAVTVAGCNVRISAPQRPSATIKVLPSATQQPPTQTPTQTRGPTVAVAPMPSATPSQGETRLFMPSVWQTHPTFTPTATAQPTQPPPPTPTPTIPWPEPLKAPGRSKLGLHVQWNNSPDIMEFIRRYKPAVVKGVDDLGFMEEVKKVSPSTVTIGRLSRDSQNTEGDPIQAARAYVARNLEDYKHHPWVDYWEGLNEPGVRGRMDWYATYEAERVRLMAEHGLRCAIGSFSTGVPEWEEIPMFLPAIRAAQRYNGVLALHEYDAPTFQRSVGSGLPGRPSYPNRGALALRYRWWYEDFLKPRGLVIPLVITEAGVDGTISNHPGPKGRGWWDYIGYWKDQGLGEDGVRAYIEQLAWYDAELQKDAYVIGFAVFTAGPMGEDWRSFDITPVLRQIAAWVVIPSAR